MGKVKFRVEGIERIRVPLEKSKGQVFRSNPEILGPYSP